MKVGFIGAGRMGRPMVARLVEAGHEVRALGRDAEKRDALERLGASTVGHLTDVAAQADVVVVCVFSDDQLRQVCLDSPLLPAMPPGSALVVHTTASPSTIDAIAARADAVDVVDAAVSGGPHDIAAGGLTLFVGGAEEAVARVQPVLGCYGDPVLYVGPRGAGQKVKLVNNALFAAQIGLLAEAVRLGVAESSLLDALTHGSATSRVLSLVAGRGSVTSFIEATSEFIGKDVAVVRGIAKELGSDLGVLDDLIETLHGQSGSGALPGAGGSR